MNTNQLRIKGKKIGNKIFNIYGEWDTDVKRGCWTFLLEIHLINEGSVVECNQSFNDLRLIYIKDIFDYFKYEASDLVFNSEELEELFKVIEKFKNSTTPTITPEESYYGI